MKNITLRADEKLIEAARARARIEGTTLNNEFRRWLAAYAQRRSQADEALSVVERLRSYVRTGGRSFTRDEMNERGSCPLSDSTNTGSRFRPVPL
jgi:hypothetical protein